MRLNLRSILPLAAWLVVIQPALSYIMLKEPALVRHERREGLTPYWVKGSKADAEMVIPVRIGMVQENLHKGDALLMEMSDPDSPTFGKHLSAQEVQNMFAPPEARVGVLKDWLQASGLLRNRLATISSNNQWLEFDASVYELEHLLQTTYHEYEHQQEGYRALGCDEYYIPAHIQDHVDFIVPAVKTIRFPSGNAERAIVQKRGNSNIGPFSPIALPVSLPAIVGMPCSVAITPKCIRTLYNITDSLTGNSNNSIGIYETANDYYGQTDLNNYFTSFASDIPSGTHPEFRGIDGAPPPSSDIGDTESSIDFEAAYPLVYPDKIVLYQVDDELYQANNSVSGLFNTFLDALDGSYCKYTAFGETGNDPKIDPVYPDTRPGGFNKPLQCGVSKPTNVISISYSANEDAYPVKYQKRQCNEFMKLGLQGISIIMSSGDSGVAQRDGTCPGSGDGRFSIHSPTNCPYVTSVGATGLKANLMNQTGPETASTQFGSTGGFSNIYARPPYQTKALNTYFKQHAPSYLSYNTTNNATVGPGLYNRAGRGVPDVAVNGQRYAGFAGGIPQVFAGTSISAPLFAGMITRINSARLDVGKSRIGFLNQILYAHPEVFNDIVIGSNPGCNTDGFSCVKGWDPVTGLGTPNYGLLKSVLMNLP